MPASFRFRAIVPTETSHSRRWQWRNGSSRWTEAFQSFSECLEDAERHGFDLKGLPPGSALEDLVIPRLSDP